MRIKHLLCIFVLCIPCITASSQQISAPEPQTGSINGTVTDVDNDAIPGATVVVDGDTPSDHHTATSNQDGFFELQGLRPAVPYHVTVNANGFANWTSPTLTLKPGQFEYLAEIKLRIAALETSVTAITTEQIAIEQVKAAEQQRVFGVIPNFYVVYDKNPVPLSAKLKYQLAFKAATDIVSIGGAAVLAGINQAANNPDYVQGAKGYGQRFGAAYADGLTDIMIGGAILPSLLHQDPRYFYQGTGTKKSRTMHALSSPFWCMGDNGKWQFNYSSIGGDLASGALTTLYYPETNRGAGLVLGNAALTTGGRMLNAVIQEFVLRKLTSRGKNQPQN